MSSGNAVEIDLRHKGYIASSSDRIVSFEWRGIGIPAPLILPRSRVLLPDDMRLLLPQWFNTVLSSA
ncbi:hypothetical protein N7478_011441 [Penicillium angulare]|uniref:uncharacterized protein n=1 Tax=Penicillium angulare TaxID=116970 RepID=UPI0025417D89|nr:uncharacterized protein N7478_011441 [Penicillium angulare]KAJ5263836.1 hypothetical protein N7478_011441 [Penicillium angulare]